MRVRLKFSIRTIEFQPHIMEAFVEGRSADSETVAPPCILKDRLLKFALISKLNLDFLEPLLSPSLPSFLTCAINLFLLGYLGS